MKNIILLAPPAAGKGTQAEMLISKYNVPSISTGNLLRAARNADTEIGRAIIDAQDKGILVSDELVLELIKNRLSESDCSNGYILDGFPRTLNQAIKYDEMLESLGKDIGVVLYLDIDKELAKKRIVGRVSCPECGATYNEFIESVMPKFPGKCDACGRSLVKRSDDNEASFEVRFNTFIDQTSPLIKYYEEKGILYKIDSNLSKEDINLQIENVLSND